MANSRMCLLRARNTGNLQNERFVTEYLPEPMRKLNVERKRAYTQAALIMYNNYLAEHPEEQKEWEG